MTFYHYVFGIVEILYHSMLHAVLGLLYIF